MVISFLETSTIRAFPFSSKCVRFFSSPFSSYLFHETHFALCTAAVRGFHCKKAAALSLLLFALNATALLFFLSSVFQEIWKLNVLLLHITLELRLLEGWLLESGHCVTRLLWLRPVSYTHLDVYKRQAMDRTVFLICRSWI